MTLKELITTVNFDKEYFASMLRQQQPAVTKESLCRNGEWDARLLESYQDQVDWHAISQNRHICWTTDVLERFKDRLDWHALSRQKEILNMQNLKQFKDYWDWEYIISENAYSDSFIKIYCQFKKYISLEWIKNAEDIREMKLTSYIDEGEEFEQIQDLLDICPCDMSFLEKFKDRLDWQKISRNPNTSWTFQEINKFNDYIDWDAFSNVEENLWKFLHCYPQQSRYTMNKLEAFREYWNWSILSENPHLKWNHKLLNRFADRWDWNKIINNWGLYNLFSDKFIRLYPKYIPMESLQGSMLNDFKNKPTHWNKELIKKYENRFTSDDWYHLSNPFEHEDKIYDWSYELIDRFADKWDWSALAHNRDLEPLFSIGFLIRYQHHIPSWALSNTCLGNKIAEELKEYPETTTLLNQSTHQLDANESYLETHKDELDWQRISQSNIYWTTKMIDKFKEQIDWNTFSLDGSPNVYTMQNLETFKEYWRWSLLSLNCNVPWNNELLDRFADYLNWNQLICQTLPFHWFTIEFYIRYQKYIPVQSLKHSRFGCSGVVQPYLNVRNCEELEQITDLLDVCPWDAAFLERFKDRLDWRKISRNPHIIWKSSMLERFKEYIDWDTLSNSPNRNEFAHQSIGISHINNLFTIKKLETYRHRWNWSLLSENVGVNWNCQLLDHFADRCDWTKIINNWGLHEMFSRSFLKRYKKYIPPESLQGSLLDNKLKGVPFVWNEQFLERHKDQLDSSAWSDFSRSPNPYWSYDLIDRFADYWNWDFLVNNPNIKHLFSLDFIVRYQKHIDFFWIKSTLLGRQVSNTRTSFNPNDIDHFFKSQNETDDTKGQSENL